MPKAVTIRESLRNLGFLILVFVAKGVKSNTDASSSSLGRQNIVQRGEIPHFDPAVRSIIDEPNANNKAANVSSVANLVEVYEHEFFDSERQMWVGGCGQNSTQRWTSSPSGKGRRQKLPPPPQLLAPKGYEYTSEWKIDVTGSSNIRDELGWEYFIEHDEEAGAVTKGSHHGNGRRRRRWLRSVASTYSVGTRHHEVTNSTTATSKHKPKNNFDNLLSLPMKEVIFVKNFISEKIWKETIDSFNFKGFGFGFQKSMLNRKACAVIMRLPLTVHFDFFETRPWLPLFTSSCALYFPFSGSVSLNASLPVALFRYAILTLLDQMKFILTFVWYVFSKIILADIIGALILSNMIKILGFGQKNYDDIDEVFDIQGDTRRKKKSQQALSKERPTLPSKRLLQYSSRISERVGVSMTWKYDKSKGVDFKFGWWHSVLPTIDYIEEISSRIINQQHTTQNKNTKTNVLVLKDWLRQKVGSFGVVWGHQSTSSPAFSCSAALSLSGFYYRGKPLKTLYSFPYKVLSGMDKNLAMRSNGSHTSNKFVLKNREKGIKDIASESEEETTEIIEVKVTAT